MVPINNIPALFQIMAGRGPGDKSFTSSRLGNCCSYHKHSSCYDMFNHCTILHRMQKHGDIIIALPVIKQYCIECNDIVRSLLYGQS